jgi:hypothetical protein
MIERQLEERHYRNRDSDNRYQIKLYLIKADGTVKTLRGVNYKLGEKLIKELNLEYSSNTLARWMSHYIAELISGINAAESESEKTINDRML